MNEPELIQGRRIGAEELAQVQSLLATQPGWSRWRISRELARRWDWRTATGQLKDMAARALLLKLEQRGWIVLPPRRWASPNRMRHKPMPVLAAPVDQEPLAGPLADWLPLTVTEVSTPRHPERELFEGLLQEHHYLSHRSPVGENLQYLVRARGGRPVACLLFGAAAWQCAARDRHIGWDGATRARRLQLLTNNTRFLILPWVRVPHLASHVLGRVTRRLSADWQRKYGHPLWLLETFVERDRFAGTCYQAANWVRVGQTQGRTRQDGADGQHQQVAIKDVFLYPLHPRFAERLRENQPPPSPCPPKKHDFTRCHRGPASAPTPRQNPPGTPSSAAAAAKPGRQIVAVGQAAALAATVTKGGLTPAELAAWQADYAARLQTIQEHPEQTLGHIEEAVAAAAKEPLRLLTERAAHAKANATPCHCPECHRPLTDQKYLSRGIDSRFGRLRLWRGYGWCPQCAPWCFPADHALGLARKAAASP